MERTLALTGPDFMRIALKTAAIGLMCYSAFAAPPAADQWEIGPQIRGRNYSVGMPLSPVASRSGWTFQFPQPSAEIGHVHYLTYRHGPLTGKRRIVMRYRIEAGRNVRFVAREWLDQAPTISLFFQRRADNWSAKGRYAGYRWYAPSVKMGPVVPGIHEISIRLDDPAWLGVMGKVAADQPDAFDAAIADAERVGFVFGSASARGHGVYATGPAKFTLLDFQIE